MCRSKLDRTSTRDPHARNARSAVLHSAVSPTIYGLRLETFEQQVLERSRQVPVLVDFWAPWCGPCKTLGPVLERLAAEASGRWELVKVNTEEDQELAMVFEVRSAIAIR